jgi:acyltransferase
MFVLLGKDQFVMIHFYTLFYGQNNLDIQDFFFIYSHGKKEFRIQNTAAPRIEFLDFIKGIAIICVIIGHSGVPSLHNLFIFSFHIPIFFIVSGFLLDESNSITLSFRDFAYKKFKRLIVPYLATGLIIFIIQIVIEVSRGVATFYSLNHNLNFSIKHIIDFILNYGKQFLLVLCYGTGKEVILSNLIIKPIAILWFLPSLFSANIFFYFFLKLFQKYSIAIQSIIIILLTFIGYMIGQHFFLPWSIDIALVSQVFVFSGYLMKKFMIFEKKTPVWIFIIAFSIWFIDLYMGGISMNERTYNNLAISTIGAIAGSYLLMKFSYFLSSSISFYYKFISHIGRQSLVIFCFSLFDTLAFLPLISSSDLINLYDNNHWVILTGFRLCYSLLIVEIIMLLPFLKLVYYPRTSKINCARSKKDNFLKIINKYFDKRRNQRKKFKQSNDIKTIKYF